MAEDMVSKMLGSGNIAIDTAASLQNATAKGWAEYYAFVATLDAQLRATSSNPPLPDSTADATLTPISR